VVKIQIKIAYKNLEKVVNINRRKAIRERCLNCSGWSRAEVQRCPNRNCTLFPFRKGAGKQDAVARNKAIRDYCLWCCVDKRIEMLECRAKDCPLFPFRKSSLDRSIDLALNSKTTHIEAVSKAV